MAFFSPRRSSLYSKALAAVTLLGCFCCAHKLITAQGIITQYGKKSVSKGPRALGLITLTPNGKARITPVAIVVDGKFFDAASYKGTPVPMALDFGVVYEGFLSGASQGLFTITQPGQLNHNWMAEGTWLPAGAKPPETSKRYETPKIEDNDAPPVLHRRAEKTEEKPEQKPASSSPSPSAAPTSSPNSTPSAPPASTSAAPPAAKASSETAPIDDPNRPILRRGKPDPNVRHEAMKTFSEDEFAVPKTSKATTVGKNDKAPEIRVIPAISDAGGPDARPYTFDATPKEEASYREKMLDLAAAQLGWQANEPPPTPRSAVAHRTNATKPAFEDVQLHIFDLSNSNQPVLVLSAKTAVTSSENAKEITLIARTDLEGELRKLFYSKTDAHHLDETPRMELIDAVDADGDGRGELLFRRTFDSGTVYAIYRVTADQIWPLYEPEP